jgi:hypothetical protein
VAAAEQTGAEAFHHPGHMGRDRAVACVEAEADLLKGSLAPGAWPVGRVQSRVDLYDVLDVPADFLLLDPDEIEASVNACRQPLQLCFREPPFFTDRLRSSDACTSPSASAIRNPGGCSGPPWSSLRMPRTMAQ